MAGKKAEAVNASPGRLMAAVDACTRENGADVHRFFCGLYGPFLALTERNGNPTRRLASSGACGALAGSRAEIGGTPTGDGRVPGPYGQPEGSRITMGAGDTVFIERTIFCNFVETLLHEYERTE